jgi:hypothetical protein
MAGLLRRLTRGLAGLVAGAALCAVGPVSTAAAVTPGVGFTADSLATYQLNGIGWAVAQANGTVFVGGTFSTVRPAGAAPGTKERAARNFVALDAATGRPTGCRLSFTGTGASVRALAVSPDRRILYAGGRFTGVNGMPVSNLAAVSLATCRPLSAFHPRVSNWVRGLAVSPGGRVYVTGDFLKVDGTSRKHLAAVSRTGTLLAWAPTIDHAGFAVAVTPNGANVVIGGHFDLADGADSHALAIVSATTGRLVKAYPDHFIPDGSAVKSVAIDASGIYVGNEGRGPGGFDGRIAIDPKTLRQRWRDGCHGATQAVLVDRGSLYAASHAHNCLSIGGFPEGRRQHLTVESVSTPRLKVWWPDTNGGIGEGLGPRALAIAARSGHRYLFAVGEFTTVNGRPQQGILRLADAPDTGAPTTPSGLSASTTPGGGVRLSWRASVDRDDRTLTYRIYRNRSTTPLATVRADSDWWRRPEVSYTDRAARAGAFYSYRVTASDGSGNTSKAAVVGARSRSAG